MSVNSLMMPYMYPGMCDTYSSQVFLNDTTGMNLYTPPFNSCFYPSYPMMCMGDSIWNMPCMPCMPCMPYMPSFTGDSAEMSSYYPNMDNYYEKMVQNQVKYQQQTRAADITLNAAQRNMRQKGLTLNEKIQLNEQEQIMPAFRDYVEAARQYYGDEGSAEDLKNTALDAYQQQFNKTIQKDIRENGSNSLWHGYKKVITLGYADGCSAEDNIAKITGQKKGKMESLKESTGSALAGTTYGLAAGGILQSSRVVSKIPYLSKSPKLWLVAAIGTAIGWLLGKVIGKGSN